MTTRSYHNVHLLIVRVDDLISLLGRFREAVRRIQPLPALTQVAAGLVGGHAVCVGHLDSLPTAVICVQSAHKKRNEMKRKKKKRKDRVKRRKTTKQIVHRRWRARRREPRWLHHCHCRRRLCSAQSTPPPPPLASVRGTEMRGELQAGPWRSSSIRDVLHWIKKERMMHAPPSPIDQMSN